MSMPIIIPGTGTAAQALNDVLESIALQEAGLSHILNAEGEKIQAALAVPGVTIPQLLSINASVQATLNNIIKTELLLHCKLAVVCEARSPCDTYAKSGCTDIQT